MALVPPGAAGLLKYRYLGVCFVCRLYLPMYRGVLPLRSGQAAQPYLAVDPDSGEAEQTHVPSPVQKHQSADAPVFAGAPSTENASPLADPAGSTAPATPFSARPVAAINLESDVASELQGLRPVQAIQLGIRYQNQGDSERAQAIYQHVLNAEPNNPEALHLLAKLAHQVENPELALTLLGRAVYADPTRAVYFRTMAQVLLSMGRADAARACLDKASALEPPPRPRRRRPVHVPRLAHRNEQDFTLAIFVMIGLVLIAALILALAMH